MHLFLLALLPCVLSLGGQHVVPQKADMPRLKGRGSSGGKIGGSMVTKRAHTLNTCSGSPPVRQHSFHGHSTDLQEQHDGLVGEKFLPKESKKNFKERMTEVCVAYRGIY